MTNKYKKLGRVSRNLWPKINLHGQLLLSLSALPSLAQCQHKSRALSRWSSPPFQHSAPPPVVHLQRHYSIPDKGKHCVGVTPTPSIVTQHQFIIRRRSEHCCASAQPCPGQSHQGPSSIFSPPLPQSLSATKARSKYGFLTFLLLVFKAICFHPISFSSLYVRAFQVGLKFSIIKS